MTRSARLAVVTIEQTGPAAAAVLSYNGQDGIGLAYAPTLTVHGTGDYTIEFAAKLEDQYGNSYPIDIRHVRVSIGATAVHFHAYQIVSPNEVRVRTFDTAAPANCMATVTVY